jgi:hypothetical protein
MCLYNTTQRRNFMLNTALKADEKRIQQKREQQRREEKKDA